MATSAPAVAPTASPIAAPPAGSCPVDWANAGPAAGERAEHDGSSSDDTATHLLSSLRLESRIATGSSRKRET